jgi:hypothetical protein
MKAVRVHSRVGPEQLSEKTYLSPTPLPAKCASACSPPESRPPNWGATYQTADGRILLSSRDK